MLASALFQDVICYDSALCDGQFAAFEVELARNQLGTTANRSDGQYPQQVTPFLAAVEAKV